MEWPVSQQVLVQISTHKSGGFKEVIFAVPSGIRSPFNSPPGEECGKDCHASEVFWTLELRCAINAHYLCHHSNTSMTIKLCPMKGPEIWVTWSSSLQNYSHHHIYTRHGSRWSSNKASPGQVRAWMANQTPCVNDCLEFHSWEEISNRQACIKDKNAYSCIFYSPPF